MQLAADFLVGGSNPGLANLVWRQRRRQSTDQNRQPKNCRWLRNHSTEG